MTIEKQLANIGLATSLILLLSPFPNFVYCHKKTMDKEKMIQKMSSTFLLINFHSAITWTIYAIEIAD